MSISNYLMHISFPTAMDLYKLDLIPPKFLVHLVCCYGDLTKMHNGKKPSVAIFFKLGRIIGYFALTKCSVAKLRLDSSSKIYGMPGKFTRTISLKCHYVILFRSAWDAKQIITFGSQLFPRRTNYFKDAYETAISILLMDMHRATEDKYRLRTQILTNQDTVVYEPKI